MRSPLPRMDAETLLALERPRGENHTTGFPSLSSKGVKPPAFPFLWNRYCTPVSVSSQISITSMVPYWYIF